MAALLASRSSERDASSCADLRPSTACASTRTRARWCARVGARAERCRGTRQKGAEARGRK
eukprot:1194954-Pleurochrysis_carterae.AAC.1